jgi:hypothetical protein
MPATAEAYKDVIDKLNQLVAEAHAQAPAEPRSQIETGYEEVIAHMFRLLAMFPGSTWKPGPSGTSTGTGTCTIPGMGTYQNVTKAQCDRFPGSTWKPKVTDPHPQP